jgi:AraC-like DNA-binding protein
MTAFLYKIIEIITSAGAALGFFFGMSLISRRKKHQRANLVLSALLIVLSISILHSLLGTSFFESPYKIREPFILLIGPLLSFYIYELTGFRKIGWKDSLHFFPFIVLMAALLPVWTSSPSPYSDFLQINGLHISKMIWALIVLQFAYYWWNIVSDLDALRVVIESEFSNVEGKTLTWIKSFLHVFGLFLFLLVITVVIAFHTDHYNVIDTIVCFGLSLSIFGLGHNGLFQGEVFSNATPLSEIQQVEKPQESDLVKKVVRTSVKSDKLQKKLQAHIETAKPYLNESLTLTELARQIGVTRNQLSFLINNTYGGNFYSYINKFRVEEVKRLIADPKNNNFTILSLAYEAGFPSKSSFHTIFKKFTGLTPVEYRNSLQ